MQQDALLRDVDVGVAVPNKVYVGPWEVLADENPPVVAGLIVPLEAVAKLVVQNSHAGLVAPAVGLQGSVRLGDTLGPSAAPVVVLQKKI